MAYKRRYLAGQLAVTVDIADQAVTTDKIGDDAVGPTQLQDDSISTGKIIDGQVKAADIGLLAVTTEKIQESAVTESKLASGAVTSDKLGADVQQSVRPFVPGLPTAEIGDAAITAVKLGAEAVETDKLKDGAVSSDKIAALAITNGKIAPDSIGSDEIVASAIKTSELDNLSVSEGKIIAGSVTNTKIGDGAVFGDKILNGGVEQDKIAADAVQTLQIEDLAVTEPKLATAALSERLRESYLARITEHSEDFGGEEISNKWIKTGAAGGAVYTDLDLGVGLWTGAVNGNDQRIDWGTKRIGVLGTVKPKMSVYIPLRGAPITFLTHNIGLWKDGSNHVVFYANDVGGATPNWFAKCVKAGAPTTVDTGVAVAASIQLLSIDVIDATHVKFYIDGAEVAEITTNIPDSERTSPRLELITRTAAVRNFYVKYLALLATRADFV